MKPRAFSGSGLAASPVLVGAVTLLVTVVAVFLSYNANSGLPFVPTYDLEARVPNAANLVVGNDVRIGGSRVGTSARSNRSRAATAPSPARCSTSSWTPRSSRCPSTPR